MPDKEELIVMKFGGSCLQNANSFEQTIEIIKNYLTKSKLIIVSSAMKGITDKLIDFYKKSCTESSECEQIVTEIYNIHRKLINQIIVSKKDEFTESIEFLRKNIEELTQLGKLVRLIRPSLHIQDLIISYGEKLSTYILTQYLNSKNITTKFISSHEIIITDDNFGNALPLLEDSKLIINEKLVPFIENGSNRTVCITGFYGATKKDKKITTLGRGGSDLTAAVLAYSLQHLFNCKVVYWKDVKGLLDADPKIAKKTSLLRNISYIEAKELAFFGTKVLHPLCLDVCEKGNVPSEIRYFNDPESKEYTTITKEIVRDGKIIKAITSIYKLSMVTVESDTMVPLPGTASKIFSLLGDNNVNIVFISQSSSENNITFGIDFEDSMKVSFLLRNSELFGKKWFRIKINNDISLVAIIGAGVLHTPGIAGKVFMTLGNNNINVLAIAQGSSELNFTAIIERQNCKKAINILYDAFIS
ncbi:MAG: aspartate kinase [Promethearchaeota archaeon]|nr:MAG: aspartate kinase [Candidatus Lokiarchaeota archaeon]